MPAFTFEKLSPPAPSAPAAPVVEKRRGVIFQMLDRFVKPRVRRVLSRRRASSNSRRTKPHG